MKKKLKRKVHQDWSGDRFDPRELRDYLAEFPVGLRAADLDYRIVVPSRRRPHLMAGVLRILPTAYVSIAEEEVEAYTEAGLDENRLMVHSNSVNTLAKKRNWIFDNTPEECCIQADDDLIAVVCRIGKKPRRFKDPGAVLQVVENSVRVAKEMGVPAFCWSRTINIRQGQFKECDPITLNPFLSNVWGQIGRKYRCDVHIQTRPDVDVSLQMMQRDRIFLMDERFYFDCGVIFQQAGGNQGIRTAEKDEEDRQYIKQKWGQYIIFGKKNVVGSHKLSIKVPRKQ